MKTYSVKITPDMKADLRRYLGYIQKKIRNSQAVAAVAADFRETKEKLKTVAGSITGPESFMGLKILKTSLSRSCGSMAY